MAIIYTYLAIYGKSYLAIQPAAIKLSSKPKVLSNYALTMSQNKIVSSSTASLNNGTFYNCLLGQAGNPEPGLSQS